MTNRAFDHSKYSNWINPNELVPYEKNAKKHDEHQIANVANSISRFGWQQDVVITTDKVLVIGHGRRLAALKLGCEVPYHVIDKTADELTDEDIRELRIADNQTNAETGYDLEALGLEIADLEFDGFDFDFGIDGGNDAGEAEEPDRGSLAVRFVAPPFSILDTRQGYWKDRKNAWLSLGIRSELGRAEDLTFTMPEYMQRGHNGVQTSVFDPVLCEIAYRWFCTDGGTVFDCFAGGAVRGVVADKLGYKYIGIDLRAEQVEENKKQAKEIGVEPVWYCDDSLNADKYVEDNSCDMLFTCPPYADLEVYSDDPRDISNMEYEDFCKVYAQILAIACRKLKDNRFAVVVIGDVRDKDGAYRQLVDYTRKVLRDNGLVLYNDLVLVESVGSGAIRASHQFCSLRKVVKMHQNVLVFYKGKIKAIKENFGELEQFDIESLVDDDE